MCDCKKDVKIGSYNNQVELVPWWRKDTICIDSCLASEIKELWGNKILTTGCCCGHNKLSPMINVDSSCHNDMISLGYKFWINDFNVKCYTPKTYTNDK